MEPLAVVEADPVQRLVLDVLEGREAAAVDELEAVANALNTRPRKTLDWKTPAEALDELLRSGKQASVATTP